MDKTKFIFLGVLVVCGVASPFVSGINPYYYDILIGIGINVILAAGLNLVNGYTGQFSLGHAGFMAVGAYASSWLTLSFGFWVSTALHLQAKTFGFNVATTSTFVVMLLAGGLAAALAGLLVG